MQQPPGGYGPPHQPPAMGHPPPHHGPPAAHGPPPMGHPQPPAAPVAQGPLVFRMHGGAKLAYNIVGALLVLLVITIPFAVWVFIGAARARLELHPTELLARGFWTKRWSLPQIRRLGVLRVPVAARGIGGVLARKKVGGSEAIQLRAVDDRGRKLMIMVSMYERYPELIDRVSHMVRLPVEPMTQGVLGAKWPGD